jgi:hypothetical protein
VDVRTVQVSLAQARWVARRMARILPTHYFHVVFTLPAPWRALARRNRRPVFSMLFAAASETLLELGRDPKWLGAELGITAVLHTWTRELVFHPHLHCIVTGGGLTDDASEWRKCKRDFLLPVHVLGALFRGKMLAKLRRAIDDGKLDLGPGPLDATRFDAWLDSLYRTDWVVYAKRPFGGAEQVVQYLGRYTHRIGISNQRIVSHDDGQVTFRTKNGKRITLPAHEFLARFLQHVLPAGFVKIRHYGLMAPCHATTRLELARCILETDRTSRRDVGLREAIPALGALVPWRELLIGLTGIDPRRCPMCGKLAVV